MRLFLAVAGLVLAGCGGDAAPTAPADVAGTFTLARYDGHLLPYTHALEASPGTTETITSGSMALRKDGTWYLSYEGHFTHPSGGVQQFDDGDEGTFVVDGSVIVFTCTRFDKGRTFETALPSDRQIVVQWNGVALTYVD